MSQLLLLTLLAGAEPIVVEDFSAPLLLPQWRWFRPDAEPNVVLDDGRLLGGPSSSPGLVALTRGFPPQDRVQIEFRFAFGGESPRGRSLNLWTHEPGGRDASQFNLCVQSGGLLQFSGPRRQWMTISRNIRRSPNLDRPVWHRLRAIVDRRADSMDYWLSDPGVDQIPADRPPLTVAAYRANLPISAIDFVSGQRIAAGNWYLIDDLRIVAGDDLPKPHPLPPPAKPYPLWNGAPLPQDPEEIPEAPGLVHRTIHRPDDDGYHFLHGAAIVHHRGVWHANWANSPTNENGPRETLQGRRSRDAVTWSDLEVIGPGFDTAERHSHGILFEHDGELWTICSRFGIGVGSRFPGLQGEAFVLGADDRWKSRGIVMKNCWPYDEPVRMDNGCRITGGQDQDGLPVVAISRGSDLTKWDSVLIPYPPELAPSFAETTVWADGSRVLAVIRGGGGVAWVSTSDDFGRSWTLARPSNLPMPRAKAYLGRLSTGELYLLSNYRNRDTLVLSLSQRGDSQLSRIWRIRHGKSQAPRFPGRAKSKQWSYPYGFEHQGRLYVVYSVGKEECGLTVVDLSRVR